MKFHPAAQILAWCLLVVALQAVAPRALFPTVGLIMACAYAMSAPKLIQLVRRTRWIMLSLLAIYAYSTPGHALSEALGIFGPTVEGLFDGALQLARLLGTLAALAILLHRLHRQQLIAGLYALFAPLDWLGISRDRIAVRLALTLHYAEVALLRETRDWQTAFRSLFEPHELTPASSKHLGGTLCLPLSRFSGPDALLIGSALLVLWLVWS